MRVLGFLILVMAGLCVGGCARDPFVTNDGETRSGEWYIAHQIDRVTGAELPNSVIFALASNSLVDFPRISSFQLTCLDKKPLVRFAFDFKVGADKDYVVGYRFDDKPGHENVPSKLLKGQQAFVIEDSAALAQFVSELPGAIKLYVRLRSETLARTSAEYTLEGSGAAIEQAFAKCPMTASPGTTPQKRTS